MLSSKFKLSFLIFLFITLYAPAQTWVDSLTSYAHEKYLPAEKYKWTWMNAALLRAMVVQYELADEDSKDLSLDYVQTAMDNKLKRAHGKRPNAVASAHGLAFLSRILEDKKYKDFADKIYSAYLNIPRGESGGINHLARTPELWDDTIYMIGIFLLEMYRSTTDEKYLDDLMEQFRIHREKLLDEEVGLWVHGWDGNNSNRCALCGQRNWPDEISRRSSEFWGRGNGWIVVLLSDMLKTIPKEHQYWKEATNYLKEMISDLPKYQDESTGHWFQLPVKPELEGNWIESSCTAMFAYGILTALQLEIITGNEYEQSIHNAYKGLRKHSIHKIEDQFITTKNVCKGTCIGDEDYYLNRKSTTGKAYGIGMFIIFGLNYEKEYGVK